jgi:integral membrane sensor domain MASE1
MQVLIFALACFVSAELGQFGAASTSPMVALYWPSTGLVFAILLSRPRAAWPLLITVSIAAIWLSLTLHGRPPLIGASAAVITGVDAFLAATLVRSMVREPFVLDRVSHTAVFVLASLAAPAVGGLIAGLTIAPAAASLGERWLDWLLSEAIGILAAAPLVITALRPDRPLVHLRPAKVIEVAATTAAAIALAAAIFGSWAPQALRVPAYVLPFLLWPAIRFGAGAASVTVFAVCPIVLWFAVRADSPLAQLGPDDILLRSHGGMVAAAVTVLLLASVVSERKRIARERDALVTELQQALAEIKTLRGFIPLCAWCHKVRDDAGFWQEIEQYLGERTDATISHGICPACVEKQTREIQEHRAERALP